MERVAGIGREGKEKREKTDLSSSAPGPVSESLFLRN